MYGWVFFNSAQKLKEFPPSPYGISKLSGENYLRFIKEDFGINATVS